MESKGRLHEITRDWKTGKFLITFEIDKEVDAITEERLSNGDLEIKAVKYRKKKSLDSMQYFHKLRDLIADARTVRGDVISKTREKNELITSYGQPMYLPDGDPLTFKTNEPPESVYEREDDRHYLLVKADTENGKPVYFYKCYYGCRYYDSREMSILIEGTIADAKELGIETATPDEQARMLSLWKKRYEKHNSR